MNNEIKEISPYAWKKTERVYIPVILKFPKDGLEHYKYIKTIDAGSSMGHILQAGDCYYMCLSADDTIRVEERIMEPFGFRRNTIQELVELADIFNEAYRKEIEKQPRANQKMHPKTTVPPNLNMSVGWMTRVEGCKLINIKTLQTVSLEQTKAEITRQTGLSVHLLNVILREGIMAKDWCFYGQRLDGFSWEEYHAHVVQANQETP